MTIPQAFQLALQHHQAGRLADAEALYRQILAVQPKHADALRLLGVIAQQAGRHDLAVKWIRQAVLLDPNNPAAHSNLAQAYHSLNRIDEAIASYSRALELKPDHPESHYNLGVTLRERGRLDEAIAAYRTAIQLNPHFPEAHSNLGNALRDLGRPDEAVVASRRALELRPNFIEAQNNLGIALTDLGQFDEAVATFRRALNLKSDYAEAHNNLGNALNDQGQLDEALVSYHRALQINPNYPEAHNNLGNALRSKRRLSEATAAYRRAIALKPRYPDAHYNLGITLREQGKLDEAAAAYRCALELKPDNVDALNNLGGVLKDLCQLDEAIATYRHALVLKPGHAELHSNLLYTLAFHPGHYDKTLSEEHQRWNRRFGHPSKQFVRPHSDDRDTGGRLRVGYVSPDFRDHPVGRYVLPLFKNHSRERFEILCYSGVKQPDSITERLRVLSDEWRNTVGISDSALAEMIQEDRVDILVDLAMHTAGNRLPVFARQSAPVQVTWLAYPGSTGLHSIAYRLTDAYMEPPGDNSNWFTEEPVRLPDSWCCYDPVSEYPDVNALPASSAQGLTFGSLNNFAKLHDGVLARWARLLEVVKGSRLIIFCPEGRARERVQAYFGGRGIREQRVEFVGYLPRWDYLSVYQRIDLGLDPFPFNGMATTCDALWMGVPVLTLPGMMPASRAGLSLLSSIGLGELVALSEESYLQMAAQLAGDLSRIAALCATLRARMLASPLMDAPRFARNVELALQSIWGRRCHPCPCLRD